MKIRSRKFKPHISGNQGRTYARGHYRICNEFSSNSSLDFYHQNQGYRAYSRYKYPDFIRDPVKSNKRKFPSRPPSPVLGSEEYMMKRIEETSAIIMKQLLNPSEQSSDVVEQLNEKYKEQYTTHQPTKNDNCESTSSVTNCKGKNKRSAAYNIQEIHEKIVCHITNLNDGKKKNLINSNISGYDDVIERIQKQKRLELSQAIRVMCSQSEQAQESSDFINSIIPDIGIKIEDLPHDLLEELRNTLNFDLEFGDEVNCDHQGNIELIGTDEKCTQNICQSYDFTSDEPLPQIFIKSEPTENSNYCTQSENSELNYENSVGNINSSDYNTCKLVTSNNENSTITVEPTVCEKVQVECSETTQTVNDDLKEDEPSECNCLPNANGCTAQNLENCENLDVELSAPRLPISVSKGVTCDMSKKDINNQKKSETNLLTIGDNHPEIIQDKTKTGTGQNSSEKSICTLNVSTQTDEIHETHCAGDFVDILLSKYHTETPKNISETVARMFEIDQCISKLTHYRQSLFANLNDGNNTNVQTINTTDGRNAECNSQTEIVSHKKRKKKKKKAPSADIEKSTTHKRQNSEPMASSNKKSKKEVKERKDQSLNKSASKNKISVNTGSSTSCTNNKKSLELDSVHEKVLVIKFAEDKLVAGTETGKTIFFDLENGKCVTVLQASHVPITSLLYARNNENIGCMYVGSFESVLKIYNCNDYSLIEKVRLDDRVQCMECNWGHIFIGCMGGSLIRYSLKKKVVEYEDKFSDASILVLKATLEGARRVLLIGSRNMPVCIRDAMTGLYMRTMEDVISPTVYSLILEKNLVYCGTTNHDILVYSFNDGKRIHRFKATNAKGIGCMKIEGKLLFASCHNGDIYVYDIKKNVFIDSMRGPGGVILSMEILKDQVILGTMSFKFIALPIPRHILQHKR